MLHKYKALLIMALPFMAIASSEHSLQSRINESLPHIIALRKALKDKTVMQYFKETCTSNNCGNKGCQSGNCGRY